MPTAIIMAGGEGTRLRPFTHTIPKPLLPIGRKPIAQILIEQLCASGFHDIIITLGHGGDIIRAYFQDGSRFGATITYFEEPYKMGTAGCLAHLPLHGQKDVLVTNGDLLTDVDFGQFLQNHIASGADMTVGVREDTLRIPYGVINLTSDRTRIETVEEKPAHSFLFNAGIYALSPAAFAQVPPEGLYDMTDLITALIDRNHVVRPEHVTGLWYDLAQVEDFDKALTDISSLPAAARFL